MTSTDPDDLVQAALDALPADLGELTVEHWQLLGAVAQGLERQLDEIGRAQREFVTAARLLRKVGPARDRLRAAMRFAADARGWDFTDDEP